MQKVLALSLGLEAGLKAAFWLQRPEGRGLEVVSDGSQSETVRLWHLAHTVDGENLKPSHLESVVLKILNQ